MGQANVLQALVAERASHATPPAAAATTMERVRVVVPEAQVLVQLVQAVQEESLQSTGHAKVLQEEVTEGTGQPAPSLEFTVITERDLVLEPLPQDLVHAP